VGLLGFRSDGDERREPEALFSITVEDDDIFNKDIGELDVLRAFYC